MLSSILIFETGTRIIGFINPNKNNDNDRDAFGVDEEEERRRKGSGLCNSWNLMGGLRRGPLSYFDSNTFGSTPRASSYPFAAALLYHSQAFVLDCVTPVPSQ